MTALLEKVFTEAQKLPDHDQDILASIIMEEMRAEQKWDTLFSSSQDKLERLAEEALREFNSGKTTPLQFS